MSEDKEYLTIEKIAALAKILDTYKLDKLKFGELELTKSRHESIKNDASSMKQPFEMTDEEILFHSTSAPPLPPEVTEMMTNIKKQSKVKRS